MLEIKKIKLHFDQAVLDDITFQVKPNEIIGIAGKSGVGKTSLLKIIAGLLDADSGQVLLDQKLIVGPSQKLIPGYESIQLVNQDFKLDDNQTTEANITNKLLHLPQLMRTNFVTELLNLLALDHVRHLKVNHLSGGEQQRVAIARALAMEPQVLLLDEPFVHLDSQLRFRLISYLIALKNARKMQVVIVSHNYEELLSLSDRIIYLKQGKLKRIAKPLDFYYNYQSISEARMFGLLNQLNINGKSIHFRPDEYEVDNGKSPQIPLRFMASIFMGSYCLNEFKTELGKKIVLLHTSEMNDVKGIKINRRRS